MCPVNKERQRLPNNLEWIACYTFFLLPFLPLSPKNGHLQPWQRLIQESAGVRSPVAASSNPTPSADCPPSPHSPFPQNETLDPTTGHTFCSQSFNFSATNLTKQPLWDTSGVVKSFNFVHVVS